MAKDDLMSMNPDPSALRNKGWMKCPDLHWSATAPGVTQLIDCLKVLIMQGSAWFGGPTEFMEEPSDDECCSCHLSEQGCADSSC